MPTTTTTVQHVDGTTISVSTTTSSPPAEPEPEPEAELSVTLLDYGAGNVRSVRNAIQRLGYTVKDVTCAEDILSASKIIFPGVGSFGYCMEELTRKGFLEPLLQYIRADRPMLGVCLGMQVLFDESEETPGVAGLGIIPGKVTRFDDPSVAVPHMGWNESRVAPGRPSGLLAGLVGDESGLAQRAYFVHSFRALPSEANKDWVLTTTDYGNEANTFISSVQKGNICATQFHPEKSGEVGLRILRNFLQDEYKREVLVGAPSQDKPATESAAALPRRTSLSRRVVACLDVRANDQGDLVVTKGDSYDVREEGEAAAAPGGGGEEGEAGAKGMDGFANSGAVRNLGKPVTLAERYYLEGADEITFLNITAFRGDIIEDPVQGVLRAASERIFVPLCIGGGIRNYTDKSGKSFRAVDVASAYFRSGADKVSLGSDAVKSAEALLREGSAGACAIADISNRYGRQAVVISVDPRRIYLADPSSPPNSGTARSPLKEALPAERSAWVPAPTVVRMAEGEEGPLGEQWAWYACTSQGGRKTHELDAMALAQACETLGAGEILLNCIDKDGKKSGFDLPFVRAMKAAVGIPVIASSGAGAAAHFTRVFQDTTVEAALAAGMFHRREVSIEDVKAELERSAIPVRRGLSSL